MKIRQGFVSNSSSSSFIALAFSIVKDSIPEKDLLLALGVKEDEYNKVLEEEMSEGDYGDREVAREMFWWQFDGVAINAGFRILSGSEDGVGKDDEVIALILEETGSDGCGGIGEGEITLEEDTEEMKKIMTVRDKMNPGARIRAIYGTRCC